MTTSRTYDATQPARPWGYAQVLVFFYGGSWKSGQRAWYRWVGEALVKLP